MAKKKKTTPKKKAKKRTAAESMKRLTNKLAKVTKDLAARPPVRNPKAWRTGEAASPGVTESR